MEDQAVLPSLPASDVESLGKNKFDPFYETTPRAFWDKNEIIREEIKDFKKCEHVFKKEEEGARCVMCHFGLLGEIELKDGVLLIKGEPVSFTT